jgi:amidase
MNDDLDGVFSSAVGQSARIRKGEVSSRELVDTYLSRIDELNPTLNCYITVAHDSARAEADRADQTPLEERGPFHGVPIAIKDMADTKGIRSTWGSVGFRDRIPTRDATVVRRLKEAGFIILGKTNTPEFAFGATDPIGYGPCRNPWDTTRSPSGSSGGSAVAAAAGLCAVAHGSDTGGSLRCPAAACGVVALKPSRGRVSNDLPGFDYLSQEGPISRTVLDAAAVLDCIAGHEPGDAYLAPRPERPFADEVGRDPGPLRIAFMSERTYAETQASWPDGVRHTADPIMWEAVARVAGLLSTLGHDVVEAAPNWHGPEHMLTIGYYHTAAWMAFAQDLPAMDLLDPIQQDAFRSMSAVSLPEYVGVLNAAQLRAREVERFWSDDDVVLMPTLANLPPLVATLRREDGTTTAAGEGVFTYFWNITGQPAMSLPLHRSDKGLPIGVQLVGRVGDEATLIRLAAQLEQLMPWAHLYPPPMSSEVAGNPTVTTPAVLNSSVD